MTQDYGHNNLHSIITLAEVERIKKPGQGAQERIDSTSELLGLMRAELKNKYKDKACTDIEIIKTLMAKIDEAQNKVNYEITSSGYPMMTNETTNEIIKDIRCIVYKLLEIAAREDMFDKVSIPTAEAPPVEGVRRERRQS